MEDNVAMLGLVGGIADHEIGCAYHEEGCNSNQNGKDNFACHCNSLVGYDTKFTDKLLIFTCRD